jgi:hypothetical protein
VERSDDTAHSGRTAQPIRAVSLRYSPNDEARLPLRRRGAGPHQGGPVEAPTSRPLLLVALTPAEAADLLELAQAGAADDHSAAALLGHLSALVERARLHDTRQDTNQ